MPPIVGDSNPYSLRNANDIQSIRARIKIFFNSFFPSTIRAWNSLPQDIKDANTVTAFKYCSIDTEDFLLSTTLLDLELAISYTQDCAWCVAHSLQIDTLKILFQAHFVLAVNLKAVIIFFSTVLDIPTSGILTFLAICSRILFRNCFTEK